MGRRGMGRLLELGPQRDLGFDSLAELRSLVAHAPDEGAARHGCGMVGFGRVGCDDVCVYRRQYVLEWFAQLRHFVAAHCKNVPPTATNGEQRTFLC